MTDPLKITVSKSEPGIRLDTWLHRQLPQLSRSALIQLIDEGQVTVDDRSVKPRYTPKLGEIVRIDFPPPRSSEVSAQVMRLDILFEDEHLLVINKAPGICVHPSAGHADDTLVNGLLHHCQGQLSGIGDASRPGIVHRLDQDTSGCIVAAKTNAAHANLVQQFACRTVRKTYQAIACGRFAPLHGDIQTNIVRHPSHRKRMAVADGSGRSAHTKFRVIEHLATASLLEARPLTGRTHQIRVHLKHLGFPIFGDKTYGNRQTKRLAAKVHFNPQRHLLHAWKLAFEHPDTGQPIHSEAPLPQDFNQAIATLKKP
ncbi:MAG: Ribosomal large subunit pseudouridine synthase D [Verrucomicrobia subdivision 3 bacterium]|nr:Ribosomal large subunit pseudouridine synthase D [Limisphaerales bacterium]MCS1412478.1 Ribosomal large subunit pseudouridine synthase D [Limisphaerales bacterium]